MRYHPVLILTNSLPTLCPLPSLPPPLPPLPLLKTACSIGASCSSSQKGEETAIMSTLYAYSKAALYDVSTSSPNILAATYMGPMSWKSSISHKEQSLVKEDYRTFNNLITPARPQAPEDVDEEPLFVMKVGV